MSGLLRPLMLTLARKGFFTAQWSDRIGQEWRRNAVKVWQVPENTLDTAWEAMEREFPDANIDRWHELTAHDPDHLPRRSDPKDWHVIMAGARVRQNHPADAVAVLTWNIKDFKRNELRRLGLRLTDPDRLLCQCWSQNPQGLQEALDEVIGDLVRSGRRRPEAEESLLKRDRLFRLVKLKKNATPERGTCTDSSSSTQA